MNTIAELLSLGGCQFKVFDLGRRIEKIRSSHFITFEQGAEPYPSPIQGHACFAIVFAKPEQAQQPFLWLLKFPLDEQSKLVFASRDDFLRLVIEALGNDIANGNINTEKLNNHAYSLKPSTEKLAVLNARIRKELHQPASLYYESAYQYFCQQPTELGWQTLGLQGIADLSIRLEEPELHQGIAQQLEKIPEPAFNALAQCIEHSALPAALVRALLGMPNERKNSFWLRAISGATDAVLWQVVEEKLMAKPSQDELITIAARHWRVLTEPHRVLAYLEAVAATQPIPSLFATLVADLNALAACRSACMMALRSKERSSALAHAIGQLVTTVAQSGKG